MSVHRVGMRRWIAGREEVQGVQRSFWRTVGLIAGVSVLGIVVLTGPVAGQVDTDGDGLSDSAEIKVYATDPADPDTDGDGVLDGVEVSLNTDPKSSDSDSDGLPDAVEYLQGSDPQVAEEVVTPERNRTRLEVDRDQPASLAFAIESEQRFPVNVLVIMAAIVGVVGLLVMRNRSQSHRAESAR